MTREKDKGSEVQIDDEGYVITDSGAKLCRIRPDGLGFWDKKRREERLVTLQKLGELIRLAKNGT